MKLEGKMTMPEATKGTEAKMPNMLLKGTIKITLSGGN